MKVKAVITLATAAHGANLDICEASYQGVNERVLACPGGRIKVTGATYGRPADNRETCCANKKKCGVKSDETCTVSAADWVASKCNDESECTLFGGMNGVLGDPCRKRHKYLNVQYECDYTTPVKTASFCEARLDNRSDSITCQNEGEVITIKSATWGRNKDSYCCPFKKDHECLTGNCRN
jgi:hypothetical protein